MTDPQAQNSTPNPQGGKPWANPMDAPPPFPNAGPSYNAYSNPYTSTPNPGWTPSPNYATGPQRTSADERMWAMLAHLSAPIAAVVSAGWLTIVGPLVVYLTQKDRSHFVRNASAGAFNFTLAMWLVSLIGWILTFTIIGAIVGVPMILIGAFGSIVLGIVGAIKSWNGEAYTYPWQLKVLN